MEMAAGTVPAFPGLKTGDCGLSFAKSMDFARVSCVPGLQRLKLRRAKVPVMRNAISGSDTVQMQPASEGSPLLGTTSRQGMLHFSSHLASSTRVISRCLVHRISWHVSN